MLSIEAVTRSVQAHWRDSFSSAVTVFSRQQINTRDLSAWAELWLDGWDERVRRQTGPDELLVLLTVHCFSRERASKTRIQELIDGVRSAVARRLIDVRDYAQPEAPLVGQLRFREAESRDLTRSHGEATRGALSHVVVMVRGAASARNEA